MKMRRWMGLLVAALITAAGHGQPTVTFTRPGSIIVTEMRGNAATSAGGKTESLKVDDRRRGEMSFKTERRSMLTLEFSNAAVLKLGSDSEVAVEEFFQQPHSQAGKTQEWKEEPSPSRTRLRLVRGDLALNVKPLKVARGSTFTFELIAGSVRITRGTLLARVQMTELGLGLCTLTLEDGDAEFEPVGGKTATLAAGKTLALAIEVDRESGAVKLSEAPKEEAPKK